MSKVKAKPTANKVKPQDEPGSWTSILKRIFSKVYPKKDNPLKNSQRQIIIMGQELRQILLDWRQEWQKTFKGNEPPHDWVFFNPNQKHKQARGFRTGFKNALEKAEIPYLTPHGLRHYFCSHGLMSGVSKEVLRRQVGHASTQMIEQTYGHFSQEYQAREMKTFSFFHSQNGSKPAGNGDQPAENSQSRVSSECPEGAPKEKTGDGSGAPKST